ncbi:MAG: Blue-light-activated protein [Acidobacteria bacterium]|nr:Blue-light-activated protein [Acidobacteriota bacterium]
MIEEQGYAVLEARSPAEAIAISRRTSQPIQLLLTDVIMPGMTGLELAAKLIPERPELRLIFMSGYSNKALVNHASLPAEARYLEKPIASAILLRTIRAALDDT